jgi:Tetratricopeptide repeat
MRWARWITPFWPGLTQLWFAGSWWGVAVGCGFAWLASLAVVSTLVWTEWLPAWQRGGVWCLLLVVWSAGAVLSFRQLWCFDPAVVAERCEGLFRRAQREYLSSNWVQAEQLLTHMLELNPGDVDAQLLLASLLRRTGQLTEAAARLDRLIMTDGAEKWETEIEREQELLDEQLHPLHPQEPGETTPLESKQVENSIDRTQTNQAA